MLAFLRSKVAAAWTGRGSAGAGAGAGGGGSIGSAAVYAQESSPFFRLPGEVRNACYKYCLHFDYHQYYRTFDFKRVPVAYASSLDPDGFGPDGERRRSCNCCVAVPPLMLACKRTYRELGELAASRAAVVVTTAGSRSVHYVVHTSHRSHDRQHDGAPLGLRSLHLVIAQTDPCFSNWTPFVLQLVERCRGSLTEFTLEWHADFLHDDGWADEDQKDSDSWRTPSWNKQALRFLGDIAGVDTLQTLWILGNGVPESWARAVQRDGRVKAIRSSL